MARSFLTGINLNQNQIISGVLERAATAPSSPVSGQAYFDTVLLSSYVFNGSTWQPCDASKSTIIPAAAITNLATTVKAYHLNEFAAPTANIPMAGFKLTGLNTAPNTAGDSAEYSWVVGRNLNTIANATANTANIPMAGYTLTGLNTAPNASGQAAEYSWVLARPLSAFAAPAANIPMAGYKFTGLGTPTATGDSAEYTWVLGRSLSAFAAPTGNIPMAGYKLTGLGAPSAAGDSATYDWVIAQVQAAAAGIASKPPVQCIGTANLTLSGLQTIDGYTTLANDRVLCVGQTTQSQNGIYLASAGAWTRATDDGPPPGELEPGAMWLSVNGTVNAGTQWRCSNTTAITVGTTAVTIVQFGAASVYSAGNGITFTGSVISANVVGSGGVLVGGSGLSVDTSIVARKWSGTIGDGSATSFVVTHGLNTQDVHLSVRQAATPYAIIDCDMAATSTTTATIAFATAPTSGQYRVTVIG
jgi:hypothetical protein